MQTIYYIWNDDLDTVISAFIKRESAFDFIKEKKNSAYYVKEVKAFEPSETPEKIEFYNAKCTLDSNEMTVERSYIFPEIDDTTSLVECSEVTRFSTTVFCSGTNLDAVSTAIRKYIAKMRYDFEVIVRRVCNIVQPRMEAGEIMTIDQICKEANATQDEVVKILLLLQKEGFIEIVDPQQATTDKLWTPKQAYIPIKKKK